MKLPCTICGNHFKIKLPNNVKKPYTCRSCNPARGRPWTKEEIETLKRLRITTTLSATAIGKILGMTSERIIIKSRLLKLRKPKKAETYGERKTVNGIIMVKTARVNISRKKKKPKYQLVWMALKDITWFVLQGEIPEGYVVKIKDMKKPQDNAENLELALI